LYNSQSWYLAIGYRDNQPWLGDLSNTSPSSLFSTGIRLSSFWHYKFSQNLTIKKNCLPELKYSIPTMHFRNHMSCFSTILTYRKWCYDSIFSVPAIRKGEYIFLNNSFWDSFRQIMIVNDLNNAPDFSFVRIPVFQFLK
jgi:hypothetical protein